MNIELSVIVPTYNRSDLLAIVLKSLCDQTAAHEQYEIIVVDNNSTDDTRAVTAQIESLANVRYVLEAEQGLSAARNRGWREAQAAYVAYVDDDCKIPPGWVEAEIEVILTVAPHCFGGPYYAFYLHEKPDWFKDAYGSHVQADEVGFLTQENQYLSGGNITFRRTTLDELGGFSPNFGMIAKKIGYGDETELLVRLRADYGLETLYFSPEVFVYHLVRPEKMNWRWILKNNWASGRFSQRMILTHFTTKRRPRLVVVTRQIARVGLNLSKIVYRTLTSWKRDHNQYPFLQNYLYEVIMSYVREIAMSYEILVTPTTSLETVSAS